jgi:cytochrome c oxidase subunit II
VPPSRRRFRLCSTTVLLSAVAACGGPFPQSTLAPKADFSAAVDQLFTGIFWWAVVVFTLVEGLLLYTIIRYRRREGAPQPKALHGHTALEIGWTLAPALILVFIAVPTMRTIFATAGAAPAGALRVEVIGHQWWWEYRYPDLGIVTANELHVPVATPVQLTMTSADVIHSFWAPALGGKRDVMQGRTTRIAFRADSSGEFLGQCAEFCGASHANMRLRVFVEPDSAFQRWAAGQRADPAPLARGDSLARLGREEFGRGACIACHTVAGMPQARGTIGPDLTHVGSRTTLAGGMFPNTAENLRRWIHNAPSLKPGSLMPAMLLPDDELAALVAYLQSLR